MIFSNVLDKAEAAFLQKRLIEYIVFSMFTVGDVRQRNTCSWYYNPYEICVLPSVGIV